MPHAATPSLCDMQKALHLLHDTEQAVFTFKRTQRWRDAAKVRRNFPCDVDRFGRAYTPDGEYIQVVTSAHLAAERSIELREILRDAGAIVGSNEIISSWTVNASLPGNRLVNVRRQDNFTDADISLCQRTSIIRGVPGSHTSQHNVMC